MIKHQISSSVILSRLVRFRFYRKGEYHQRHFRAWASVYLGKGMQSKDCGPE